MSQEPKETTEMVVVFSVIGGIFGTIILAAMFGVVAFYVAGGVLSLAWAISIPVLLAKILNRMPAPQAEFETKPARTGPAEPAAPAPPKQIFSAGLYDVKRDDKGRIIAEQ